MSNKMRSYLRDLIGDIAGIIIGLFLFINFFILYRRMNPYFLTGDLFAYDGLYLTIASLMWLGLFISIIYINFLIADIVLEVVHTQKKKF